MNDRQELGAWGERQAAEFLAGKGYLILDRNVRTHFGEIDLVGLKSEPGIRTRVGKAEQPENVVVFIEVKTRRSNRYGLPEESVTKKKKAHILAAVQAYMQMHPGLANTWRIDVISIQRSSTGELLSIDHFENAFS